jgi:hypothetical protein
MNHTDIIVPIAVVPIKGETEKETKNYQLIYNITEKKKKPHLLLKANTTIRVIPEKERTNHFSPKESQPTKQSRKSFSRLIFESELILEV